MKGEVLSLHPHTSREPEEKVLGRVPWSLLGDKDLLWLPEMIQSKLGILYKVFWLGPQRALPSPDPQGPLRT